MIDTHYPTADQLVAGKRSRSNLIFFLFAFTLLVVFGTVIGLDMVAPTMGIAAKLAIGATVFVACAVPVIIWMQPLRGLQFILLMCMLVENDGRNPPIMLPTCYVPFFLNFNVIGSMFGTGVLDPIKFSPAEAIMVLAFGSWLVRSIANRELRWRSGAFLPIILLFTGWVTFGFVHGLATGGDFLLALWEVRAFYLFAAIYIITTNLITDRKQLQSFAWIIIVGLGLRSLLGLYAYLQLAGNITDQGIIAHDDSLMFNLLFFIPVLLYFNKGPRTIFWASLACIPTALFADLENNRRAGIAAFIIAFAALLLLAWFLLPERKQQLRVFVIATALVSSIYLPIAWNSQGQWAFPARAVRSQFDPDPRDAGSDAYRMMEDTDLKYTRDTSPFLGVGYGKPWIEIIPLPKVSTGFLQYVAHDSVLWIWMRLGHIGFTLFLLMIAQILIKGSQACRTSTDPIVQMFGMLAILFMMMAFIYGKYDLQFANYRSMIALGFFVGVLGILPRLTQGPAESAGIAMDTSPPLPLDLEMTPPLLNEVPLDARSFQ